MSDTDEEIVPSSQPADSSMISFAPSQPKRTYNELADADEEPSQGAAVQNPMDEQLGCAICQEIMYNPFLILPCMHSYCRTCLFTWWQNKADCPTCKTKSQLAKHNFQLANIINQHRQDTDRVSRRRLDDTAREDLYPPGRRPFLSLPSSLQSQSQSQGSQFILDPLIYIPQVDSNASMGSQSQGVVQPLADVYPGGNLVFPCPSCDPNNTTGYTCPEPIIAPTAELIASEQEAYRPGGVPLRAPGRGDPRVGLQAARFNTLPGAASHNQCDACKTYIPAGWEPEKQSCGDCGITLCSNYDPAGCNSQRRLLPRTALSGGTITTQTLWFTCPFNLRGNVEEQQRFESYLINRHITIDNILERIAEMKLQNEKQSARRQFPQGEAADEEYEDEIRDAHAECDRKWGANAYFCDDYIRLLMDSFLHWWITERRNGPVPANLAALPDCWYGFECRTQHNQNHPGHSARYNHICPNTAAERG